MINYAEGRIVRGLCKKGFEMAWSCGKQGKLSN